MTEFLLIINVYVEDTPDILSNVNETLSLFILKLLSLVCGAHGFETDVRNIQIVSLSSPAPVDFLQGFCTHADTDICSQ